MKLLWSFFLLFIVLPLLSACSSTDEMDEGPAPLTEFEEERRFVESWSASIGDGQGELFHHLLPSIANDVLYAASADGTVAAFSMADGDRLWQLDLDQALSAGIGIGDDLLLLAGRGGSVIAVDRETRQQRWQASIGGEVLAPPQFSDGLVYVQTVDAQVIALSAVDGTRAWSYRNTIPVLTLRGTSTPLVYRNLVIAGFANGRVVGFDAKTGAVRWDVRVASPKGNSEIDRIVDVDGQLLLDSNIVYAVSYQGSIAAIDADSGRRLWSRDASSHVGMSQGFGNVYVSGDDGSVTAFFKNGQGVRWAQTVLSKRELSASAVLGSYVIIADFEGYLHALSQVDGHLVAREAVDSDGIRAGLFADNGRLIVYSNGGKLAVYTLQE